SANRSNLAAKFVRKLNSKVPQTADALHRNKTTRRRAAVSQGVKGRDSGTKQRRCFGVAQRVGYFRQCVDGSDHVLLIAPVVADTRNFGVAAVKVASTPAFETRVVLPAMPADANALSPLPSGDLGAQLIDDACHLVPRHPRILDSRPEAFFHENVTVANTTGLHSNAHLSRTRFGNLALNYFETCSRLRNLCHLHRSYCDCCCHEPSFEIPAIVGKAFYYYVPAADFREMKSTNWRVEQMARFVLVHGGFPGAWIWLPLMDSL